jgi:leucyl-tRNA synthetase
LRVDAAYPGKLHMGHVRNYTINDVMPASADERPQRADADGWDAFGLPLKAASRTASAGAMDVPNIAMKSNARRWAGRSTGRVSSPAILIITAGTSGSSRRCWKRGSYKKTGVVNWDPVDPDGAGQQQVIDGRLALGCARENRCDTCASPITPRNSVSRSHAGLAGA